MKKLYEYDGRKCEFCDDNRIYYTSEPHEVGIMEREWLNNLKNEISNTSEFEHNVIINLTWFRSSWEETEVLRNFVNSLEPKDQVKLWFTGSVDGNYWITYDYIEIYHYFVKQNYNISFVGYAGEHWNSWYPEWFIRNNLSIKSTDVELNTNPEFLYLCYNRKPRMHREWLINSILENNLLDRGWVTFERGHYPEIDAKTGNTDQDKHSNDVRFSRPEDITSLGDLNIWNNSYLVVVSETDHDDPWQLSEKTWKPIFGLRPFLINGGKGVYDNLEKLGFYTPKDLFKNNKLDSDFRSVVEQLKNLYDKTPGELHSLWKEQYSMLVYNRQRMFEMAESDKTKILNWSQAKPRPII